MNENETPSTQQGDSSSERHRGAIAQLGERLHGMQEVSGSIPLSSTKFRFRVNELARKQDRVQQPGLEGKKVRPLRLVA